eukprot:scaffold8219_cov253-Ochromonas_danica.AAC.1
MSRLVSEEEEEDGQLALNLVTTEVVISDEQRRILESVHNSREGHFGVKYTVKLLRQRNHNWDLMTQQVTKFIRECPI